MADSLELEEQGVVGVSGREVKGKEGKLEETEKRGRGDEGGDVVSLGGGDEGGGADECDGATARS